MNTTKIAGLYAATRYALFQLPSSTPALQAELQQRLRRVLYNDDVEPRGWHYNVSLSTAASRNAPRPALDFFGERTHCHLESYCSPRVLAWARQQVPAEDTPGVAPADRWLVTLAEHAPYQSDLDSAFTIRLGQASDFAALERGIRAYQRKRQKYVRKRLTQLAAYHQQQVAQAQAAELTQLRQGVWLGADKALTTAARTSEPGVPYLGDAGLSDEQRRGLAYWAVPEAALMGPGFPAGTGLALRPVKRGRELVDGAVYLYHYQLTEDCPLVTLGRLRLHHKSHGMLPLLRDEAPDTRMLTWAAWSDPKFKLYQVVYYTTRAAEPLAATAAQALRLAPAEVQYQEQELALAA